MSPINKKFWLHHTKMYNFQCSCGAFHLSWSIKSLQLWRKWLDINTHSPWNMWGGSAKRGNLFTQILYSARWENLSWHTGTVNKRTQSLHVMLHEYILYCDNRKSVPHWLLVRNRGGDLHDNTKYMKKKWATWKIYQRRGNDYGSYQWFYIQTRWTINSALC